jgi:hypothetical protein
MVARYLSGIRAGPWHNDSLTRIGIAEVHPACVHFMNTIIRMNNIVRTS